MATKSKFSPNGKYFELLTTAVAGGQSIRAAAATCGCSESHAYHFSHTQEFKQRVNELRTEATSEALGRLSSAATAAVATLIQLLKPDNEPSIRMNAAKAILNSLGPMAELSELRARLDAIESQRQPKPKVKVSA